MSGRGGRGRGGRGRGRGRGGRGRGSSYTGANTSSKKGLCAALGDNVFDYGHKAAADQLRTSWEKLVQYVGTTYGQDISNELLNKTRIDVGGTNAYSSRYWHATLHAKTMVHANQARLATAREYSTSIIRSSSMHKHPW